MTQTNKGLVSRAAAPESDTSIHNVVKMHILHFLQIQASYRRGRHVPNTTPFPAVQNRIYFLVLKEF